jgi:hypothetical protein
MTRSGRLLLSVVGALAIATSSITGAAAAPLEPPANPPAAPAAVPDATSPATVTPNASVPGAPFGVAAIGAHTVAVVSWFGAVSLGSSITAYTATAAPGGKNCIWTTGPLTCTITGLVDRTTYSIQVTATNASGTGPASAFGLFVTPLAGSTYHPLTPARILDSRNGTGLSGPFSSHAARAFSVTGQGGVPSNATAVTGNLTVTAQTSGGYLFIGPVAVNDPTSSALNFPVGDDRANGVTVGLGPGGTLSVTFVASAGAATAHVIFDVVAYFTTDASGSTYTPLNPKRILDTRDGTGSLGPGQSGPLSSHVARTVQVMGGVVPVNALAVTGNLTVTGQTSNGYLYVGPVPVNDPTSSSLNFPVGDDRANGVTVALSAPGIFGVTFVAPNPGPTAHVVFDVTGYFVPDANGATWMPLTPTRVLDSRDGTGGLSGPFSSHVARTFALSGVGVISANAVTGNLTVTSQTSKGYLYIGPAPVNDPTSSTINFPVGDDRANGADVALGAGGALSVTFVAPAPGPTAHVIFDVTGYFMP